MLAHSDFTPEQVLRIAVVNDYEVIVRGLAAMLADVESLEVVELDSNAPVTQQVDIALYDALAVTGASSGALRTLLDSGHVGAVILYTAKVSPELVEDARSAGMSGVIDRSTTVEELADLLHRAHAGEFVVSPSIGQPIDAESSDSAWPGRAQGLSAREAEVISLITQGLSNQEIAENIYVSINSIKSYIRSAYRTMGVTTRSQAVLWGIENGMAPRRLRDISRKSLPGSRSERSD